jgi:tRNA1(Val) A37 N6-methylase TrmN6
MLRLEDLNLNGLKIYQDDELYCFTSYSILLSKFASVKKGDLVAGFCSGSGIVGLHLYGLNCEKIQSVTLFEMQKPLFDLSVKTIEHNKLLDKFTAVNCKIQDIPKDYNEKFSLITCNPPYMSVEGGQLDKNDSIAICKSELQLPLEELIKNLSRCLKFGGRACVCHRADRLCDLVWLMRKYNLEPKRLQTVQNGKKAPYLIMIEGVKGGKSSLKILPPAYN